MLSNRLLRVVKTVPHRWDTVRRVLDVRWKYLEDVTKRRLPRTEEADAPRKSRIFMGGIVLAITFCKENNKEMEIRGMMVMKDRQCNWANTLETLLNRLLGPIFSRQPQE